ncbi:uncharacterized protein [Coffea arabica]|uniref:Chromo domain-containing protein n=1 Tax=Coffea arabica TaxID=13443 RepID=A0ABM4VU63_COFAR
METELASTNASEMTEGDQHPQETRDLLEEFSVVFQQLVSLPPVRTCDHEIPLKPGAQPFKLKPYRYPHSQKDEIENKTWELHLYHLRLVLTVLKENQLFAKRSKCSFAHTRIDYLGHTISEEGVSIDSSKIDSVVTWPTPKSVKDLRGFLGLTGYYRRFIKDYGILCKPLTDLLRKHAFVWTDTTQRAFDLLKKVMTLAPILRLPNFKQPFVVETDASGGGIGLIARVLLEPEFPNQYQLSDGILRYKGKLFVGSSNGVREQTMEALHSSSIGGHSGQRPNKWHKFSWIKCINSMDYLKLQSQIGTKSSLAISGRSYFDWLGSAYHSSLSMTPFEALYGYKALPLPIGPYYDSIIPAATQALQERMRILACIKEHLLKAQQRTKYFVDRHRTERSFEVGDLVFLKLQPYRQQTIAIRKNLKLATKFYGPFEVEEKIGEIAYKLKLPPAAKIHQVFHVSLPKKRVGPPQQVSTTLPEFDLQDQYPLILEMVFKRRAILRKGLLVVQYLIKWQQLEYDEASWEDKDFIEQQFPKFETCGQV